MSRLVLGAVLAAMLLLPGIGVAQDTETPTESVTIDLGDALVEVDGMEPMVACSVEQRATLTSRSHTLRVIVRGMDGAYYPLGTFETRATGPLENAVVGDCPGLEEPEGP